MASSQHVVDKETFESQEEIGTQEICTQPLDGSICTQPLDGSILCDASEAEQMPRPWSSVQALNFNLPVSRFHLFCKENHFGRDVDSCDFAYKAGAYQIEKSVYGRISQRHFTIHEYDNMAYLVDHSRHGTFVNGTLVSSASPNGERRVLLESGDKISVVTADGPCLQFHLFSHRTLGIAMPSDLTARYLVENTQLGSGASCTVHLAMNKNSFGNVAMKVMRKDPYAETFNSFFFVEREIQILKSVKHEMIVNVLDIFEDKRNTFIAMELMAGGSLMSRIFEAQENRLDEGSVRVIAYQLLLALEYLHFNNIIHRDIKPANILMCSENEHDNRVKLADFGLSKLVSGSKLAVTKCGTRRYKAPEVRLQDEKAYTAKVDIWSLGATIHLCLSGKLPRYDEERPLTCQEYLLVDAPWDRISSEAKELVQKMLLGDPEQRPSARELLEHSWFKGANFEMIKKNLPSPVGPILPPQTPKKLLPTAHCGKSEKRLSLGARPSKPYSARLPVDNQVQDSATCRRLSLGPVLSDVGGSIEKEIPQESSSRGRKRLSLSARPSKPYSANCFQLPARKDEQDSATSNRRHSLGPILSDKSSFLEKGISKEFSFHSKKRLSLLPRPKRLPRV